MKKVQSIMAESQPNLDRLESFFKAEVRSSGKKLVTQEKMSIQSASDTSVHALVRGSPHAQVKFTAKSISSTEFLAECSCAKSSRGQMCKHIWATLLGLEVRHPDFLTFKQEIGRAPLVVSPEPSSRDRAREYQKEQYQKKKTQLKALKNKKAPHAAPVYPDTIQAALFYFSKNGFDMSEGPSEVVIADAKRKLSRVFHPDKGGSHEEMVELNQNCELLLRYLAQLN